MKYDTDMRFDVYVDDFNTETLLDIAYYNKLRQKTRARDTNINSSSKSNTEIVPALDLVCIEEVIR